MLLQHFQHTRQHTQSLCQPLCTEDYIPQAAEFVSPPKWHLAHTTWFFEQMILKPYVNDYQVFDDSFNFLFNSYYQGVGERALRCQRGLITRPTVDTVYQYRHYVDKQIELLLSNPVSKTIQDLVQLGIHHEQQHQELLITDLKYVFGLNPTYPVYHPESLLVKDHNSESGWLTIEEGMYGIGHNSHDFCFDNELGYHPVHLPTYHISKSLVTNREYLEFINDGGYENFHYWLDEGFSWLREHNITQPLYWHCIDGQWYYYTLAGLKAIDMEAMVCHISYYEANAYACWKQMRLPTEFEWEAACSQLNWGKRWEWTSSAYQPYPGFCISEGAVGEYNGKFMVNQMVLRGASVATPEGHARSTYRNFFHPYFQWQYSGIRLAKSG